MTETDIRRAVQALSRSNLDELYADDFIRISNSGQHTRECATQVFSMLLCAQEALSPEALIQVTTRAASHKGETMNLAKIIDICSNLVVLDSELNMLRFAHISFQEFLETKAEFASYHVHKIAAVSCLDACIQGLPTGMDTNLCPKDNLYHYSAVYWAEHCKITIINRTDAAVTSKMLEFVFDEDDVSLGFIDWIQEVGKFSKKLPNDHALVRQLNSVVHPSGSPLFTACMFGLTPIIDGLASMLDCDWNQSNGLGQSGLYLAAAAGHRTIVQSLLQHEANINAFGGKFGYPLHAACFGGHSSTVQLLLDYGADPKTGTRSALEYALLANHENFVLLLLKDKLDVSSQTEFDSILQQAAEAGFANVVHFLQKEYASSYGDSGSLRHKAVELAIFKGRTNVVERHMQS